MGRRTAGDVQTTNCNLRKQSSAKGVGESGEEGERDRPKQTERIRRTKRFIHTRAQTQQTKCFNAWWANRYRREERNRRTYHSPDRPHLGAACKFALAWMQSQSISTNMAETTFRKLKLSFAGGGAREEIVSITPLFCFNKVLQICEAAGSNRWGLRDTGSASTKK